MFLITSPVLYHGFVHSFAQTPDAHLVKAATHYRLLSLSLDRYVTELIDFEVIHGQSIFYPRTTNTSITKDLLNQRHHFLYPSSLIPTFSLAIYNHLGIYISYYSTIKPTLGIADQVSPYKLLWP